MVYLAVSDLGVAVGIGGEHPPEGGDAGGVLEGGVVREGAVEVPLDLLCGQGALAHGPLHQVGVVTLVGGQLRHRACTQEHTVPYREHMGRPGPNNTRKHTVTHSIQMKP